MQTQMKPCPRCRAIPKVCVPTYTDGFAIHVRCRCGLLLYGAKSHFGSEQEAIDAWNTRAGEDVEAPNASARLADIQRRLVARGVVDVKLHIDPGSSVEQAALHAAHFLTAYLEGQHDPAAPIGDSVGPLHSAAHDALVTGINVPAGWRIQQNADGSIGLFSPPPSAGQSPRTSHAFYPGQRGDAHELVYKLLEDMLLLKAGQGATSEGLEALADRIALKRRDGSADSHWLATLELDLRTFVVAGLHAPASWSAGDDGEPAPMLARPSVGATAKCTCDGACYEPDQRHPFIINRSCPVHGASQAPHESRKAGGALGPECAFGTSGLELAPLGGPSDSACGGGT